MATIFPEAMVVEVPPVKNEHTLEAQSMEVVGDKIGAMDERVEVFVGIVVGMKVDGTVGETAGRSCSGKVVGYPEIGSTKANAMNL